MLLLIKYKSDIHVFVFSIHPEKCMGIYEYLIFLMDNFQLRPLFAEKTPHEIARI